MQTRFFLLVGLISWGLAMTGNARFTNIPSESVSAGIKGNAGLQMEFLREPGAAVKLLGEPGNENWRIMRKQQYLDFVLIALYWWFFTFAFGECLIRTGVPSRILLGWIIISCITVADLADILEDTRILAVLNHPSATILFPFPFASVKWIFFFLAAGGASLLLLRYPHLATGGAPVWYWIPWLARLSGVLLACGFVLGTIEMFKILVYRSGPWLPLSAALAAFHSYLYWCCIWRPCITTYGLVKQVAATVQ